MAAEKHEVERTQSEPAALDNETAGNILSGAASADDTDNGSYLEPITPGYTSSVPGSPPFLSRNSSGYFSKDMHEMMDETPPDKITIFDVFDNLALPTKLEKWQMALAAQRERLAKQQQKLRSQGTNARDRAVAELRKRVPTADERLARYRKRMKSSLDNVNKRWTETVTITTREKISFISAVLNIFISGYLIGAMPERFYWWFTIQFFYFMPVRYYTYHRKGYHYFLADLCYFVNALALLSIWVFPQSKRLFLSSYCLAYGNNAIAIVMWRNSLVFHSFDKVTSLFIHVMPPVVLHCMVHLTQPEFLHDHFPAVFDIKFSPVGSPEHYTLLGMVGWATLPYAVWQLSYHFLITVRRRDQIAAGRPTSFTWLRKSYAKTWIGKIVLALPDSLQEPAFMFIQYAYACLTILPCPIWFWYRWPSAIFLMFVFSWSIWNGANYYMDVFGKKFQKELEQMRREMQRLQNSPGMTPHSDPVNDQETEKDVDKIPMLDEEKKKEGIIKDEKEEISDGPRGDAAGAIMETVEAKLDST